MTGRPRCPTCGEGHEFVRWSLEMHQDMARYQYVYELKPVGPHRPLADALLRPHRHACATCQGRGVVTLDVHRWARCGACEGTGGIWTCSAEEVERLRQKVLAEHPHAAASDPSPRFFGTVVHNLRTGEMITESEPYRRRRPTGGPKASAARPERDSGAANPRATEDPDACGTEGPEQLLRMAAEALPRYLEARRTEGRKVKVIKPMYHTGPYVRCKVEIDGRLRRMFYNPSTGRWRLS